MKLRYVAAALLALTMPAAAQVETVAQATIPAGNAFAPDTPGGLINIGNHVWVGTESKGFRHMSPVDPTDPAALDDGLYQFDIDQLWSVGGNTECFPFCSVGQAAKASDSVTFVTVYDHGGGFHSGGIWMLQFLPPQFFEPQLDPAPSLTQLAPFAGLAGNQPDAVAIGPDGKLYFGNMKNGNVQRITNPTTPNPQPFTQTVEAVGGSFQGRPVLAMGFLGHDLYLGTDQGLNVIRNADTCVGNQGGCGNAVSIVDGFVGASHPGITVDANVQAVYFSVAARVAGGAGAVYRLTMDGRIVQVTSGFAFVATHNNTLALDTDGNLWVGDTRPGAVEGSTNSGRLSRMPAAALASIP